MRARPPRPPKTVRIRTSVWICAGAAVLLAAGLGLTAAGFFQRGAATERARPGRIGLFTTLPILWQEAGGIGEMLRSPAPPHWAGAVLAARGSIAPLDALSDPDGHSRPAGHSPLEALSLLVMAQPRVLSPSENVALDQWLRRGGHLLLFADPMLTTDSAFAPGDRRRPQDGVMLSPILARWGLALTFDEAQPAGEQTAMVLGAAVPVNLSGRLAVRDGAQGCRVLAGGLAARCMIGRGHALIVADAALLESGDAWANQMRRAALDHLLVAAASAS